MKAFFIDRYGKSDRLKSRDLPEPTLRDDDVMVRTHAAGVNPVGNKSQTPAGFEQAY
jgi:NADPH:quinone reductase-like Zn-dependent oxidoreductase